MPVLLGCVSQANPYLSLFKASVVGGLPAASGSLTLLLLAMQTPPWPPPSGVDAHHPDVWPQVWGFLSHSLPTWGSYRRALLQFPTHLNTQQNDMFACVPFSVLSFRFDILYFVTDAALADTASADVCFIIDVSLSNYPPFVSLQGFPLTLLSLIFSIPSFSFPIFCQPGLHSLSTLA